MSESSGGGGAIRELLAVFGFKVETDELEKGENALTKFAEHAKHAVEGFVVALGVEKIFEFAEANVHAMAQIEHSAVRLGISADKVQEFQFAAKSLGLEAESLLNSMGRLQVAQQAAADGSAQQSKAFRDIGVNVKDANGHMKSADELFGDVAEGISKIKDPAKQAAVAVHLLGRGGREQLPFLKEGRKGVAELGEEYRKLGGGYTEGAIEQSKKFEKQSAKLGLVWTGLKSTITQALLPPLTWIIEKVGKLVAWFRKSADASSAVQTGLVLLGSALAAMAISVAIAEAPVILLAAALAGIFLIIEDIVSMFQGKESLIGDAIDSLFGKDAHVDVVVKLKEAWESVSSGIKSAWGFLKEMHAALKPVAELMAKMLSDAKEIGDKLLGGFGVLGTTGVGKIAAGDMKGAIDDATGRIAIEQSMALAGHGMSAPPPMLSAGQYSNDVSIVVNAAPGMDEKQVGEQVANQVHRVLKKQHRESANTLRRANSQ